jgi:hypothetical protein
MKNLILKFACLIALISCDKDDDKPKTELDKLPPVTQIGAQTIGCLVNGKAFVDNSSLNNFYQFVDGEFYLVINWDENTQSGFKDGQISLSKINIQEGQTYILNISDFLEDDFVGGNGTYSTNIGGITQYETNSEITGQIHFTRFDTQNFIMSGTFEFEAKDIFSEKTISITNGRFDLNFTN